MYFFLYSYKYQICRKSAVFILLTNNQFGGLNTFFWNSVNTFIKTTFKAVLFLDEEDNMF